MIPVYSSCAASTTVQSLLGASPRIYQFGKAPSKPVFPYVTWQQIDGSPANNLSESPDIDYYQTQIDIWAESATSLSDVRDAVRDAIEAVTHISSWNGEERDFKTDNFRCTFTVDWYISR